MCRPVEPQGWSTNEAIWDTGMSELGRGYPNYGGLKLSGIRVCLSWEEGILIMEV